MLWKKQKDGIRRDRNGFIDIEIKELLHWQGGLGDGCIVTQKITKEGWKVGYMYRDEPSKNNPDSGWQFMAGDEDDDYMNEPSNHNIFKLNTICNYDPDIIRYLDAPVGTALIRISEHDFVIDDGTREIVMMKQKH